MLGAVRLGVVRLGVVMPKAKHKIRDGQMRTDVTRPGATYCGVKTFLQSLKFCRENDNVLFGKK